MLRLSIIAPFASFRSFNAGAFRPSAFFITPSAAYGLILNLAGVESRKDDGSSVMTLMKDNLPNFEIAIGFKSLPEEQTLFQQLHNYPVGNSGIERKDDCKGTKYNIQPIRRSFLSGIDCILSIKGNEALEGSLRHGLLIGASRSVDESQPCYGIPFLGDNNFMIDIIREDHLPGASARWLYRVDLRTLNEETDIPNIQRLPVWIDRADMTRTVSEYFALSDSFDLEPPSNAWIPVGPRDAVAV